MAQAQQNDPWAEFQDAPESYGAVSTSTITRIPREPTPQTPTQIAIEEERLRNLREPPPKLPAGYRFRPDGTAERIPGLPISAEEGKPVPNWAATKFEKPLGVFSGLDRSLKSFEDDFAGNTITGDLENKIQGKLGWVGTEGQRNWWASFREFDNKVRNELFGATLTPSEQAAYLATTIDPSLDPKILRANLKQRRDVVAKAVARQYNFMKAQGYNPEAVDALAGEYAPEFNPGLRPPEERTEAGAGNPAPPPGPGDIGFNTPEGDPREPTQLEPEQRSKLEAFLATRQPGSLTPQEIDAVFFGLTGQRLDNAEAWADHYNKTGAFNPEIAPPEIDISQTRQGGEVTDPIARGVADAVTLGLSDELAAGVDTLSQGGDYTDHLARERAIAGYDTENNFWLRTGGQVAGGAVLPLFSARTPAQLAKVGGAYGAAYGAGSSESMAEVPGNVVAGGLVGAGAGWGGAKLIEKLAGRTAARAARPSAESYARGQKFGVDMPMGATGRTAAGLEKGLDIMPGSAGRMQATRDTLSAQVDDAVESVAGSYGPATSHRGMGEAARRGANKWISKFEEVSGKAYDAIPISDKAQASLANTRTALEELTTIFESNTKLAETFKNSKLNTYLEALEPDGPGLSWPDLKSLRSRIGEEIGEQRFSDSPTKGELRRLYAALSEDMRLTAAAQGPQALRKFERANDLYRAGQERIDNALVKILGDDALNNPEAAASKIQAVVREGKSSSDLKLVQEVWKSLPAEERGEVANGLLRLMGQPANSAGREFSPDTFFRGWSDMAPEAKNLIFGPVDKELRRNLDEFTEVARDLARNNSLRNTSGTANATNIISAASFMPMAFFSLPAAGALGMQALGANSLARIWTDPKFVRWATGYAKMVRGAAKAGAAPSAAGIKTHARLLEKMAASEPAIAQEALGIRQMLLAGANDNAAPSLAASDGSVRDEQ